MCIGQSTGCRSDLDEWGDDTSILSLVQTRYLETSQMIRFFPKLLKADYAIHPQTVQEKMTLQLLETLINSARMKEVGQLRRTIKVTV
jgi:hypothetical protein